MDQVATLRFVDRDSNGEALVIVRAEEGCVGLAVSTLQDGDTEVFMPLETCMNFTEALAVGSSAADRGR